MKFPLPSYERVLDLLKNELDEAATSGRRPTVRAVEKCIGVPHSTFYRHYPDQIAWFKAEIFERNRVDSRPLRERKTPTDLDKLRRENTELRRYLQIYGEAIRQLTLDNVSLESQIQHNAVVHQLPVRSSPSARG